MLCEHGELYGFAASAPGIMSRCPDAPALGSGSLGFWAAKVTSSAEPTLTLGLLAWQVSAVPLALGQSPRKR